LRAGGLEVSREGYQLILDFEVGGGPNYYNRCLQRPEWPGGASGCTIGIGYDLGYNTRAQIAADWVMLSPDVIWRLQSVSGIRGQAAHRKLATIRNLVIPWDMARQVYNSRTIPRFAALTRRAYPGIETLHPHIQSSELSWTFNRGDGISETSDRDREKREIRADTPDRPARLPAHFRASKRLWVGKGMPGLIARREAEAELIEAALKPQ
jgi:hypothetical protein